MKEKYTRHTASKKLTSNGYRLTESNIYAPYPGPGIKMLGAISYLVNEHRYYYAGIDPKLRSVVPDGVG